MATFLRAANVVLGIVFLFAVAVQYNDPDPAVWMAIYGAAAVACLWVALRPATFPIAFAVLVGAVALVWAATLLPHVMGHVRLPELFASFEMKSERVEVARESGGLLIVALGMAVAMAGKRVRPATSSSTRQS